MSILTRRKHGRWARKGGEDARHSISWRWLDGGTTEGTKIMGQCCETNGEVPQAEDGAHHKNTLVMSGRARGFSRD